jgi:large subunit ribosomal protein L4
MKYRRWPGNAIDEPERVGRVCIGDATLKTTARCLQVRLAPCCAWQGVVDAESIPRAFTLKAADRQSGVGRRVVAAAQASDEGRLMQVPVLNMQGSQVGMLTIDEQSLGGSINYALLKQAYVRYHANTRQGSARTLNRHEVEGTTKKMYKQKGTGNARHGDKKVPQFKGGGHAHAKKRTREDFHLDMPKKMRRKANRNALLAKLIDNEVKIVDNLSMAQPKTAAFNDFLAALKIEKSALVALPSTEENTRLAARNVEMVELCKAESLNAFQMLNNKFLVIGKTDLENWLKGPSSQTGKSAKVAPLGASDKPVKAAVKPVAKAKKEAK